MKTTPATIAALLVACAGILILPDAQSQGQPSGVAKGDVDLARRMLDSWNGQSEILEAAQKELALVIQRDPTNYQALKEVARYQIMAGFLHERVAHPGKAYYTVGVYLPGTLEAAEGTIREAIRLNPRYAEGYVLLGHIQYNAERMDEAAKSLAKAESLGTGDPWLHLNWADVLEAQGDESAAADRWRRVLQSGTTNNKALLAAYGLLIKSYERAGEHGKAVALWEEQLKRNPSNAWQRGGFAAYLTELGRYDEAIGQARAALRIMDYGVGRRILAMALYSKWAEFVAQGKGPAGEAFFQEAITLRPRLEDVMAYGASEPGAERLARVLMTSKGLSIDAQAEDGSTALLIATNLNRVQVVRYLLELKANPDIADYNGWTPILSAADEGNAEIVNMLLAKGASLRATLRGQDVATMAQKRGHSDLAAFLRKRMAETK